MTEWVTVIAYVPARVPPGTRTAIVGLQVAVLSPETPVAVTTGTSSLMSLWS